MRHAPDTGPLVVPQLYHRVPVPEGLENATLLTLFSVFIEGLEFHGHHGVNAEEQHRGNRFLVQMSVWVDQQVPASDDVEDTVDYAQLAATVVATSDAERCKTVERLAHRICDEVFVRYPLVSAVTLKVAKLDPPMSPSSSSAGVFLNLSREKFYARS